MKNNHFLRLCCLLAVPLLWGGCSKEPNCPERRLPPISTEGLNTIGFKLDGEVWTPRVSANVIQTPLDFGELTVVYYPDSDNFYIRADRIRNGDCDTTSQVLHLSLDIDRNFPAANSIFGKSGVRLNVWNESYRRYSFDTTAHHTLKVHRFDPDQRVLSCSFECTIIRQTTGERQKITEGRLDVTF